MLNECRVSRSGYTRSYESGGEALMRGNRPVRVDARHGWPRAAGGSAWPCWVCLAGSGVLGVDAPCIREKACIEVWLSPGRKLA